MPQKAGKNCRIPGGSKLEKVRKSGGVKREETEKSHWGSKKREGAQIKRKRRKSKRPRNHFQRKRNKGKEPERRREKNKRQGFSR